MSIVLMSGCGAILSAGPDNRATLTGDPESLRAMFDGINGLIVTGKVSADQPNPHILMRQDQEEELTKRAMVPNFLSSIFSRQSASNVTNIETK